MGKVSARCLEEPPGWLLRMGVVPPPLPPACVTSDRLIGPCRVARALSGMECLPAAEVKGVKGFREVVWQSLPHPGCLVFFLA